MDILFEYLYNLTEWILIMFRIWRKCAGACDDAFHFHGIGIREPMKAHCIDRSPTQDCLIMHFHDEISLRVDGKISRYPAGTMMIWAPEDSHYYGNKDAVWSHSWAHCQGSFAMEILERYKIPCGVPLQCPGAQRIDKILHDIYMELLSFHRQDEDIMKSLFTLLAAEIRRSQESPELPVPERMMKAKLYIEQKYKTQLRLEKLASIAGLSVSRFSAEFKRLFDDSPINYGLRLRMQEAHYLLLDVNKSVGEVADETGFKDIFHFSKLFRKYWGLSPSSLKKRRS